MAVLRIKRHLQAHQLRWKLKRKSIQYRSKNQKRKSKMPKRWVISIRPCSNKIAVLRAWNEIGMASLKRHWKMDSQPNQAGINSDLRNYFKNKIQKSLKTTTCSMSPKRSWIAPCKECKRTQSSLMSNLITSTNITTEKAMPVYMSRYTPFKGQSTKYRMAWWLGWVQRPHLASLQWRSKSQSDRTMHRLWSLQSP